MKVAIQQQLELYKSLAYLFYATAVVDNRIRIEEKRKIKELVEKDWSYIIDGVNSQEIIFSMLKKLFNEGYDKEEAFSSFKDFFLHHSEEFSEGLKKKIMHTINQIVSAFRGINKSESVLISRLYFLMWDKK